VFRLLDVNTERAFIGRHGIYIDANNFIIIWWEHTAYPQRLHGLFNLCVNACSNNVLQYTFAHRSPKMSNRWDRTCTRQDHDVNYMLGLNHQCHQCRKHITCQCCVPHSRTSKQYNHIGLHGYYSLIQLHRWGCTRCPIIIYWNHYNYATNNKVLCGQPLRSINLGIIHKLYK
jgi:hypothetical protein